VEPVSPVDPLLMKDRARAIIRGTFDLSRELLSKAGLRVLCSVVHLD
jgi:hypothetical protein